jgi:hypothetical protein
MPTNDDQLSPAAKLLIQKYVLALLGGFGAVAVAVLGLMGAAIFSGIQSNANEAARIAVEKALKAEIERGAAALASNKEFAKLVGEGLESKLSAKIDQQDANLKEVARKTNEIMQFDVPICSGTGYEGLQITPAGSRYPLPEGSGKTIVGAWWSPMHNMNFAGEFPAIELLKEGTDQLVLFAKSTGRNACFRMRVFVLYREKPAS